MMNAIKKFFKENYKLMIVTFLIGILVHGFALTNELLTYDEINNLFGKGTSFQSGRWGLELVSFLFPNVSMPWYNGLFSIAILSISFCLVIYIFEVKNKYFKLLICSILMSFPAISNTFVFMYAIPAYSISILLAIISVVLLRSKKIVLNILAIITIVLSLSIYQAYICITLIMLIMLLMKDCIDEKKSINDIICSIAKYIILIVVSLGLYLVITKAINHILNISFYDYKGLNTMGQFTIKDIIKGITNSYNNIYELFPKYSLGETFGLNLCSKFFIIASLLFSVCLTFTKVISLIKQKNIANATLLLVLLIIQPIAVNFIVVINPKIGYLYSIMIYQYVFLIIESIVLYEWFSGKNNKLKIILYGSFVLLIFQFITISNKAYFHSYLAYENVYSFTSGLVDRIVETDGFDKDVSVAFLGNYNGELNTDYYAYFKEVTYMGSSMSDADRINPWLRYQFIKYFIGIDFKCIGEWEGMDEQESIKINEIKHNPEYKKMNNYPYSNSIKKINDTLVVKFSD